MEQILLGLLFILFLVVLFSIINEKTLRISNDIALVMFSFLLAAIVKLLGAAGLVDFERWWKLPIFGR